MNPRRHAVPLLEAVGEAPTLARLAQLARESGERLQAVQASIPASLHAAIHPGPIDGTSWCLLADSSAAAAKLRQLVPLLQDQLSRRGWQVTAIRVKVQTPPK